MAISADGGARFDEAVRRAMAEGASPNEVRQALNDAIATRIGGSDEERDDSLTGNVALTLDRRRLAHPRYREHTLRTSDWQHLVRVYGGGSHAVGERRLWREFFDPMVDNVATALLAGEQPQPPAWQHGAGAASAETASDGRAEAGASVATAEASVAETTAEAESAGDQTASAAAAATGDAEDARSSSSSRRFRSGSH